MRKFRGVRRVLLTCSLVAAVCGPAAVASADSTLYGQAVLADTPLGFWPLDGSSATSVADASGNGYTLTGPGTGVVVGVTGGGPMAGAGGMTFSGGYVGRGYFSYTNNFAIELWARSNRVDEREALVSNGWVATDNCWRGVWVGAQADRVFGYDANTCGVGGSTTNASIFAGSSDWHHVVVQRAAGSTTVWVDGVQKSVADTNAVTLTGGSFRIGGLHNGTATDSFGPFKGALSEVAYYNHVLTSTQITNHYNAAVGSPTNTTPPTITPTTLVGPGLSLSASTGNWVGAGFSYAYQWRRCDASGSSCTDIAGATSSTYILQSADVGSTVRVQVTATNSQGSAVQSSAATDAVAAQTPHGHSLYGQAVLADTPLGFWPLDGSSATSVADASGNGYTLTGPGTGVVVGVTGGGPMAGAGGMTFSGGYVGRGYFSYTNNFAIEVWARSNRVDEREALVSNGWVATDNCWRGVWVGAQADRVFGYDANTCGVGGSTTNASIFAGSSDWHHVVVQRAAGSTTVWVDGVQKSVADTNAVTLTGGSFRIGGLHNGTAAASFGPFYGALSDVAYYNHVLTGTQIVAHYHAAIGVPTNTTLPTVSPATSLHEFDTVTADHGTWAGTGTITYAYRWQACTSPSSCAAISGATGSSYQLTADEIGKTIKVVVTASSSLGSEAATSAASATVASAAPSNASAPSISGTATDGQTLTSTTGTWSGSATITYTRQWRRCDASGASCTDISGATSNTYALTSADVGSTVKVVVTATNAAGSATAASTTTAVISAIAPANSALPAVSGTPTDGETLTSTTGVWSGSTPITYSHQWRRCNAFGAGCSDISGATASTYTLTTDDVGATIRLVVTATNAAGDAEASSVATDLVAALPAANVTEPSISGTTTVGHILTADDGDWTGESVELTRHWQRCNADGHDCANIDAATDATYALTTADAGHRLRVVVHGETAGGGEDAASGVTDIVVLPVSGFDATIVGDARVGETMRAVPGDVVSTTRPTFTYQWERCDAVGADCDDIVAATTHAYIATAADARATLRVVVTAQTSAGPTSATSAATPLVVAPLPQSLRLPAVAGRTAVGATLTLLPGTWEHGGDISHAWLRCEASGSPCQAIPSANGTSYTAVAADAGHVLVVEETATSDGGDVTVSSRPSRVITVPTLRNLDAPTITGAAGPEGSELVVDPGTWDGDAPISYSYAWQRCDGDGTGCGTVNGASGSAYPVSPNDAGRLLRALEVATNAGGTETATSATSAVIEDVAPAAAEAPAIAGKARVGEMLSAQGATWTGTGPLERAYRWQRCTAAGDGCADIDGADASDHEVREADLGHRLRVIVEATNELGAAQTVSAVSPVVEEGSGPGDGPSVVMAPVLSGTPETGATLAVDPGVWSGVGDIAYTYRWQRCHAPAVDCDDVDAATSSLALGADDEGAFMRVLVTAEDDAGSSVVTLTSPTSVHATGAPEPTGTPTIAGTAREGDQLSVTTGTWSGVGALTFAIQWQACEDSWGVCQDIDGATGAIYEVGPDDVDLSLRAVVTARDTNNRATTVVAAATQSVAPAAPVNRIPPTISGDPSAGETLVAGHGTWDGIAPIIFTYQWQRCDFAGDECDDLQDATGTDYVVSDDDGGATLRVQVTASNGHGDSDEVSDATAPAASSLGPQLTTSVTVTGIAREGQTLAAEHGVWPGTGTITYTYAWLLCDDLGQRCSRIPDATDAELALSTAENFGTVRVVVTAHDGAGSRSSTSAATEIVAPDEPASGDTLRNLSVPTVEGTPRVASTLTATPGAWDQPGALTFAYQWRACDADGRGCSAIDGATQATYAPSDDLVGQRLRVAVTATGDGSSMTVQSALTDLLLPGLPVNAEAPTISGDPVDESELTADDGTWQGAADDLIRQWQRCDAGGQQCVDIEGATDSSYWTSSDDVGSTLRLHVVAHNTQGEMTATSEPTSLIAPLAPTALDIPFTSGLARVDGTLTASEGWWDGSREMTFTYAWARCDVDGENCAPVSGASEATYMLTSADLGSRLRVTVTATNAGGQGSSTSDPTDVVDAAHAPELRGDDPSVDGDPHDGQHFTAQAGGWYGIDPMSFAYQWQRCATDGDGCADIDGAVADSYDATGDDLAHRLRVVVTANNPTGATTATSTATAVLTQADPEPVELPMLTGVFIAGYELSVDPGRWGGSAPSTYAYQWERCTTAGEDCQPIDGATDDHYTATDDDARHAVRVAVTATNTHGNDTAASYPTAIAPRTPENTERPQITGTLHTGQPLHVTTGTWQHTPDSYNYLWENCAADGSDCHTLYSATHADYTPTVFDAGRRLRATVWAMNVDAWDPPSAQTDLTDAIPGAVAVNIQRPSVVGVPQIGQPTVVDPGQWLADGDITYTYTWRWCYQDNPGTCNPFTPPVESPTYTPTRDDRGMRLLVTVRAHTAAGATDVDSTISAPVVSGPPHNVTPPTVEGPANVGVLLNLDHGEWNDNVEQMDVVSAIMQRGRRRLPRAHHRRPLLIPPPPRRPRPPHPRDADRHQPTRSRDGEHRAHRRCGRGDQARQRHGTDYHRRCDRRLDRDRRPRYLERHAR